MSVGSLSRRGDRCALGARGEIQMGNMVQVTILIADFQRMLREHWAYEWSSAQKGRVSCAGAFVWAYHQQGATIYHGSNRIARSYVDQLIPYETAAREGLIVPGMAAFKTRKPTDKLYDLPGEYRKGGSRYNGDLNDYYHIGLVDEGCGQVLNAQSAKTGFVASPIGDRWSHVARLRDVDYGREVAWQNPATSDDSTEVWIMTTAKVQGGALFLRAAKDTKSSALVRMETGSQVMVLADDGGEWVQASYAGKTGWCMRRYLAFEMVDPEQAVTIRMPRAMALELMQLLNAATAVG